MITFRAVLSIVVRQRFTYNGLIGLLLTGTLVAVIALLGLWSAILRRK